MKQKLPLAALLIAPYVLLAGGIALLLHGKPWMILVLWALIVLLAFLPAMVCAFLLPRRGWPARRCCFGTWCSSCATFPFTSASSLRE